MFSIEEFIIAVCCCVDDLLALRLNRHDPREPAWGGLRQRIRRLIETVIGQ